MVIAILVLLGLCFGSFVNAFVWRLREGRDWVRERSECVHCHHALAAKDLVPVLSWLWLKGKCRYCVRPISAQYPLVEALTATLFVTSYAFWPFTLAGSQNVIFSLWLVLLVGLVALLIYDLKWLLLPNKLVFPLTAIAGLQALVAIVASDNPLSSFINYILAVVVGGGIFYAIFQLSRGKWIGGGDVKLGFLLGIVVGTPARSLAFIFIAAILGSLVSLPLLMSKRLKHSSVIPFGPFLIVGAIIVVLFGTQLIDWYTHFLLIGA